MSIDDRNYSIHQLISSKLETDQGLAGAMAGKKLNRGNHKCILRAIH